jgi:hypothetical protein
LISRQPRDFAVFPSIQKNAGRARKRSPAEGHDMYGTLSLETRLDKSDAPPLVPIDSSEQAEKARAMRDGAQWDRIDCLRNVANGKIDALYDEAVGLAIRGLLGRILLADATDILHEAAENNGLYSAFGVEFIQELLSDAFNEARDIVADSAVGDAA